MTAAAMVIGLAAAIYGAAVGDPGVVVLGGALFLLGCWRGAFP